MQLVPLHHGHEVSLSHAAAIAHANAGGAETAAFLEADSVGNTHAGDDRGDEGGKGLITCFLRSSTFLRLISAVSSSLLRVRVVGSDHVNCRNEASS
jgi:hypothetical protein